MLKLFVLGEGALSSHVYEVPLRAHHRRAPRHQRLGEGAQRNRALAAQPATRSWQGTWDRVPARP